MSMTDETTIVCPKCGKEFSFGIWKSINTSVDPQMFDAVRDGSAFTAKCPHCGERTMVDYGFLYHQQDDDFMVFYVQSDEEEEEVSGMLRDPADEMFRDVWNGYTIRIVRSLNRFREKLAIKDAGLDDRLVELCKLVMLGSVQSRTQTPISSIELFFDPGDGSGNRVVVLEEGRPTMTVNWMPQLYERIRADFEKLLSGEDDQQYVVDRAWAVRKYSENK